MVNQLFNFVEDKLEKVPGLTISYGQKIVEIITSRLPYCDIKIGEVVLKALEKLPAT